MYFFIVIKIVIKKILRNISVSNSLFFLSISLIEIASLLQYSVIHDISQKIKKSVCPYQYIGQIFNA